MHPISRLTAATVTAGAHMQVPQPRHSTYTHKIPSDRGHHSTSEGLAFLGARPCLERAKARRLMSGRYAFRHGYMFRLLPRSRLSRKEHAGYPQPWAADGVARRNPIPTLSRCERRCRSTKV